MGKIIKNGIEYASGSNVTVAKNIIYDNTSSGMESTNVQNAISELNNALEWQWVENMHFPDTSKWSGGVTLLRRKLTITERPDLPAEYEYKIFGTFKHHQTSCEWGELIGEFKTVSINLTIPIQIFCFNGVVYSGGVFTADGKLKMYSPGHAQLVDKDFEFHISTIF